MHSSLRSQFHLRGAEGTQDSHDPCLCVYSHDSSLQDENYAEGMPAWLLIPFLCKCLRAMGVKKKRQGRQGMWI